MNWIYLWRSNELGGKVRMSESALISIVLITIKGEAGKIQSTCPGAGKNCHYRVPVALFRPAKTQFHPLLHLLIPLTIWPVMWKYSTCLRIPPRCSDRTSLVYMNTLSSSPLSASTLFVSPHPRSPVFIFYFPFYVLASLHASVLHPPPLLLSLLYLLHLSSCPSHSSLPALPSADHALVTLRRDALPPSRRPSLLMFPHSVAYQSDFFFCSPACLPHPVFLSFNLTPLLSSISLHLLTKLSIHHASIHPANSSSPDPPNPVQTLQQWDQNVGEIEHEPR